MLCRWPLVFSSLLGNPNRTVLISSPVYGMLYANLFLTYSSIKSRLIVLVNPICHLIGQVVLFHLADTLFFQSRTKRKA